MKAKEEDLVEVLRLARPTLAPFWTKLLHEAADEIVSLRNKVKALEEYNYVVSQLP